MRAIRLAIAQALREARHVTELVAATSIHAVERAVVPVLPAVEVIAVSSETVDQLQRHELAIEVTVSNVSEDAADAELDAIVEAVRLRLLDSYVEQPISTLAGSTVLADLGAVRWSVSAQGQRGVIRGASVSVTATG